MKIKTSELTGAALDWAVAKCEGMLAEPWLWGDEQEVLMRYKFSTNWAQGGPIIERERICIDQMLNSEWIAVSRRLTDERPERERMLSGPTPLIAAMRCRVVSKMGEYVDVPEELQ